MRRHAVLLGEWLGDEQAGCTDFRKHVAWYLKGFPVGAALLASSGLPRRVRIKATKDSLKLSTAYRADQLVGDIVRTALRGAVNDIIRVQDAVMKFIRAVRERRQDGATLLISSNGRGKIDVVEAGATARFAAAPPAPAPEVPPSPAPPDRLAALERRVADLEAAIRRTSIFTSLVSPTRRICRSWIARSSFTWTVCGISVISSRKSVPPAAERITPGESETAPVNAPRR